MLIEDPQNGHVAGVTYEGFLQVFGVAQPWETHKSEAHGSVYAVGNSDITTDATENVVLHIENTSQKSLMYIAAQIGGFDQAGAAKITTYKGSSYTSGGTVATPNNFNMTSRSVAEANCYYGNDITVSGGTPLCACYAPQGTFLMPLQGVIILGYQDSLHWTVNGAAGKALLGIRFFYHNDTH